MAVIAGVPSRGRGSALREESWRHHHTVQADHVLRPQLLEQNSQREQASSDSPSLDRTTFRLQYGRRYTYNIGLTQVYLICHNDVKVIFSGIEGKSARCTELVDVYDREQTAYYPA